MTNRSIRYSYSAPSSARMAHANVKKPRLRRVEISFSGPNGPVEGRTLNNGFRSHGGNRGSSKHPPGQFSYNKDDEYEREIQAELERLIGQEYFTSHGSPVWLGDVNREITHSGESPLFVHRLLAPGKFEQEHGVIKYERALLHTNTRRSSAPSSRAGDRKYYRPNRTHQFLSATDLRDIADENVLRYGRPTRTTLLRARSRSSSAPINAYDVRREMQKRTDDLKHNSIFVAAKDVFERENNRMNYRIYNIYANDGETMHSFLTGARYNRAHLLDSKGLSTYGVYMPRSNPQNCFITGNTRLKDHGEEIPSAPPDSPRSDIDETSTTATPSRSSSSAHPYFSRPASTSRPTSSKTFPHSAASRPQSKSAARAPGSRPRSAKEGGASQHQSYHVIRKNLGSGKSSDQVTEEYTSIIPDAAKAKGVYVTLKGQKMVEMAESRLPRVTGISVPKLRKPRDPFDEIQVVNQPPPTPIDLSTDGAERGKYDRFSENSGKDNGLEKVRPGVTFDQKILERVPEAQPLNEPSKETDKLVNGKVDEENAQTKQESLPAQTDAAKQDGADEQLDKDKPVTSENLNGHTASVADEVSDSQGKETKDTTANTETNTDSLPAESKSQPQEKETNKDGIDVAPLSQEAGQVKVPDDNVVFFITEEDDADKKKVNGHGGEGADSSEDSAGEEEEEGEEEENGASVPFIRVEVSESDKITKDSEGDDESKRITADDFPFTEETELKGQDSEITNGHS